MQADFDAIADHALAGVKPGETLLLNFRGEESDFIRFNRSSVRQPGSVSQARIGIDLIDGGRMASGAIEMAGEMVETKARIGRMMGSLRDLLRDIEPDPHLLYNRNPQSTERRRPGLHPKPEEAIGTILEAGRGRDLVGIYAAGAVHTGFANSLGQRNWDTAETFNFDWSFYLAGDKAVKSAYAGFDWSTDEFRARAEAAAELLRPLARDALTIPPGRYRVYLSPAALAEIIGVIAWGGFGLKAHETKTTSLLHLVAGDRRLSDKLHLYEDTAGGAAPAFERSGFIKHDRIELIQAGRHRAALVSPRSAAEYGIATNGAEANEAPLSVEMAGGDLAKADILAALGSGLYIGNLWYLNYSDRSAARLTGMTRFATFWVEDGEIRAPVNVMRFDDSIYNILGARLEALTQDRDFMLDPGTYGGRQSSSAHLPGALVSELTFTL